MRPSLDEYYLRMCDLVKTRGTCPRRQVGAILVDDRGKLVSTGYNGTPAGMDHCTDLPCAGAKDQTGDNRRCIALHAESNAVWQAGVSRRNPHTLYCSCTPCFNCAKLLITAGIKEVVAYVIYEGDLEGLYLMASAGIQTFIYRNGARIPWTSCVER